MWRLLSMSLSALLVLGVACGVNTSGAGIGERPAANAGGVGEGPPTDGDGSMDETPSPPTPIDPAPPAVDASTEAPRDASIEAAPSSCDQDGDGWNNRACGGKDCCDTDPDAFPGQKNYFAGATACGGWDYDCNGSDDVEYGLAACLRTFAGCDGDGFAVTPACGDQGSFVRCIVDGFACRPADSKALQRCR